MLSSNDIETSRMTRKILITGASSGLGLAFVQHYAAQPYTSIIAIDISPFPLPTTYLENHNVQFFQSDITNQFGIPAISSTFARVPIHLVIHCAGVRGLNQDIVNEQIANKQDGDVAAAETRMTTNKETMMRTFEINTFGTFNTINAFLPNLLCAPNSKVIVLSSRMGSVSSNTGGGGYAYRASKAALNAVVKTFSVDVPEVTFLLLHPGRVETGLVGWKEEGAISVEESLRDCLRVIEGVGKEGSGRLVDRLGEEIAW